MSGVSYRMVERCRVCGARSFASVLSLGATPLANALVPPDRTEADPVFPLATQRCLDCGLVQLTVVVDPEALFRHYVYLSSASVPLIPHFDAYADEVSRRFAPAGSLVVEIGSNDGVLLEPLSRRGVHVLGIEPSTNIARVANERGFETWTEFFTPAVAYRIASERGRASAVLANNVLAHIDDLSAVMEGLGALLGDDGVFVAEVPYLLDMLEHVEYDTIYHEHLSYFSLAPLRRLLSRGGLQMFDVRRIPIHGGSLRLFAGRPGRYKETAALREVLADEHGAELGSDEPYARFAERVERSRDSLRSVIAGLRREGRSVAALGATAKGNTLLNYCRIGPDEVSFVADVTPLKQGLLTPGMRIPIRPEETILTDRPDYTLLLAWNYADAIIRRFRDYLQAGGRFIHPIPEARIIAT